ncbi:CBU_0592 family membrane protein [Niabella ginsenosidivorans]|nr:hypothetical protein [Niabella ginsenosidivorans]
MLLNSIGWIGLGSCTLAYLLLNLKYIRFDGWLFQALNLLGGAGLAIKALDFDDTPNFLANCLWLVIACFGMIKYFRNRPRNNDQEIPSNA